jgi:ribonuclease HI
MNLPAVVATAGAVVRSVAVRRKVWSDGSCLHPLDPLLARAAWGIRVQSSDAEAHVDMAGPVDGPQTAQRAEVAAAVAAARAVNEPAELVSDSRWVVRSVAALAAGANSAEWKHADLWTLLAPHVTQGRLVARWTPAHKTANEYAQLGRHEDDRLGNEAADGNAKAAATARLPPSAIVKTRDEQLQLLAQAQRMIAFVELAALKVNHGNGSDAAPRVRRRWADVRRGTRANRQAIARASAATIPASHDKPEGDVPPPLHTLRRSGESRQCSACGKSAVKTRWTAFAYGSCGSNACGEHWVWRRIPHQVFERNGQLNCSRCGGSVPLARRIAFEGRRCPAWKAEAPAEHCQEGDPDWGSWFLKVMGHKTAGAQGCPRHTPGVDMGPRATIPNVTTGAQVPLARMVWRPHVGAQGPGYTACISCGTTGKHWSALQSTSCGGWRERLPPRVAALLLLGDHIGRVGGPTAAFSAALAARRGETPRPPE